MPDSTHKKRWQAAYNAQDRPETLDGGRRQFNGYRHPRGYQLLRDSLQRATATWQGWRVLDAGCGSGDTGAFLRETNTVIGMDFSQQMASVAQHTYPMVNLGDVEAMPFADDSFDGVLAVGVWQCLPTQNRFLHEIQRVLRPDGEAVLGWVPNADFPLYRRGVHFRLDPSVELTLYRLPAMRAAIAGAGLQLSGVYPVLFPLAVLSGSVAAAATRFIVPAYTLRIRAT